MPSPKASTAASRRSSRRPAASETSLIIESESSSSAANSTSCQNVPFNTYPHRSRKKPIIDSLAGDIPGGLPIDNVVTRVRCRIEQMRRYVCVYCIGSRGQAAEAARQRYTKGDIAGSVRSVAIGNPDPGPAPKAGNHETRAPAGQVPVRLAAGVKPHEDGRNRPEG